MKQLTVDKVLVSMMNSPWTTITIPYLDLEEDRHMESMAYYNGQTPSLSTCVVKGRCKHDDSLHASILQGRNSYPMNKRSIVTRHCVH